MIDDRLTKHEEKEEDPSQDRRRIARSYPLVYGYAGRCAKAKLEDKEDPAAARSSSSGEQQQQQQQHALTSPAPVSIM